MITYQERLDQFKISLSQVFQEQPFSFRKRGISPEDFGKIMESVPLSAFIPVAYGGYSNRTANSLQMLELAGYHSLGIALMLGINGALFLQPLGRYGNPEVKASIFDKFMNQKKMGGLMITEPNFGSDALRMQTQYVENGSYFHVKGTKHWGGLTGRADYWLLTARRRRENGDLDRDIDFFVYDSASNGISVEEYYENLGLYIISYGRNKIEAEIPKTYRLEPESSGVKMMLDLLHRSRSQFPGMGMGYLRRLMDEAVSHCKSRLVGGFPLITYDQVKRRIMDLQASFTVCSALCHFTSRTASFETNMADRDLTSNSIKTIVTDLMQEAAQSVLQLVGAKGYSIDHIAGRSLVDSRPFQIFEGSNDILYQQISESVLKMMKKMKAVNLYEFLSSYEFTQKASAYLKNHLNFNLETTIAQHKMVDLGKAIGRLISLEMVIDLGNSGFNKDLIENGIQVLLNDIQSLLTSYQTLRPALVTEYYQESSDWASFL